MTKRQRNQGELENEVLHALWEARDSGSPGLTSNEVLRLVAPQGDLAATTVLTVLSRLSDKGLVTKSPGEGRSLLFSAAQTKAEHDARLLLDIFQASPNPQLAFSHFANGLSRNELNQLREFLNQTDTE